VAAASALVERGGEVLLVKRGKPPGQGLWALPGGSVRWGEPVREAARREVLEETGIEIEVLEVVDVVDVIYPPMGEAEYHYVVVCFRGRYLGGSLRPGSDAKEVRWVNVSELGKYEVTPTARVAVSRAFGLK